MADVSITVQDVGTFVVPRGKKLVLALQDECGIDQLHACGGNAKCTTCKVRFLEGEPRAQTKAERAVLEAKGLTDVRLSCQILCEQDCTVEAMSRLSGSQRSDCGARPKDEITPVPEWIE